MKDLHWEEKAIINEVNDIYPDGIRLLSHIHQIPTDQAVRITVYLWEGCFQTTNDIWHFCCSGLLYRLPERWLEQNVQDVLPLISLNWEDDFEYDNMCSVFYHLPKVVKKIMDYAVTKIPESAAKEEWIDDVQAAVGSRDIYQMNLNGFKEVSRLFFLDKFQFAEEIERDSVPPK